MYKHAIFKIKYHCRRLSSSIAFLSLIYLCLNVNVSDSHILLYQCWRFFLSKVKLFARDLPCLGSRFFTKHRKIYCKTCILIIEYKETLPC